MTKTGKIILAIVIIVIIGIVIGVSRSPKKEEPVVNKEPIKIGITAPLTGEASIYGEPARNVFQIATDEINALGGINGRTIELIVEDSKCNGKDGASAAQKLVNIDKVQVIIGDICSGATLSEIPVVETGKVALFSAGASSPDLTGKSSFFSRDYPSDASQGIVLADAANGLGFKKVAFIQEQTDYALGIYKSFGERLQGLGGTVTKEEFSSETTDFRTIISKIQSQKPDMIFVDTQTAAATGRILKQISDSKWKIKIFLNDVSIATPELISANKNVLEGTIGAEFISDPTNTKFAQVLATYKAKYGADMPYQSYGQTEYDAIYIMKDAIETVGYDGVKISQWLRNVKNWPGASGSVTIDSVTGDRIGGHSLEIVKDGKVEVYNP